MYGIVVASDRFQEWLLPWWWTHYATHNSFPVAFMDIGMSEKGISWCQERGLYIKLPEIAYREPPKNDFWEKRYGEDVWKIRPAWLKKPHALLHSPFELSVWVDLDCQIKQSLEPLFHLFFLSGKEIALVPDRQNLETLLPNEVHYNSGVIAFRQKAGFIQQWIDTIAQCELSGDQEYLSRSIFLNQTEVLDLPPIYNWFGRFGPNENAVIHHYSGGFGKIEIIKSLQSTLGIGI